MRSRSPLLSISAKVLLGLSIAALAGGCAGATNIVDGVPALHGPTLAEYVRIDDGAFRWEVLSQQSADGVTTWVLEMDSQRWRSAEEVDRTLWQHWVTVVVPNAARAAPPEGRERTALLLIGGGANGRSAPAGADDRALAIARGTGGIVISLSMVPNQPLAFADDGRPRTEDDLVAHTWNKHMETGDRAWLARWPMVKSAVRAMDATQELLRSAEGGGLDVPEFVVAGGSKRGWTTWLTGAVDPRVAAIIPIVIDVVNVIPSMEHHFAAYGFWAPAVGDYEHNGIMDRRGDPAYERLITLVDPYFYREQLQMPKMVINSSGDQFFLPDSSRFYFDDLLGEKHLRYVPNTDHGLGGSDAVETIASFFAAIANGTPRPRFSWSFEDGGVIRVVPVDRPREARLWLATNPSARDFRKEVIGEAWTPAPLEAAADGSYVARIAPPSSGYAAGFVELTYPGCGPAAFKLSTAVLVIPDALPHLDRLAALPGSPPPRNGPVAKARTQAQQER